MAINESDILAGVRRQLSKATLEHQIQLNEQIYAVAQTIMGAPPPFKRLPKWRIYWYRTRAYLRTLWLALKSVDLMKSDDYDY